MKKKLTILLSSLLILPTLSGCLMQDLVDKAIAEENATLNESNTSSNDIFDLYGDDNEIDYGDGSYTEVILPSSFMDDTTFEQMEEEIAQRGGKDLTILENGSISYLLPTPEYDKTLAQLKYSVIQASQSLIGDACPSFISIEFDETLENVNLRVNKEDFESSMDGFAIYSLYFSTTMYHVFTGYSKDDAPLNVYIIDDITDEIFDTVVFPEKK